MKLTNFISNVKNRLFPTKKFIIRFVTDMGENNHIETFFDGSGSVLKMEASKTYNNMDEAVKTLYSLGSNMESMFDNHLGNGARIVEVCLIQKNNNLAPVLHVLITG